MTVDIVLSIPFRLARRLHRKCALAGRSPVFQRIFECNIFDFSFSLCAPGANFARLSITKRFRSTTKLFLIKKT